GQCPLPRLRAQESSRTVGVHGKSVCILEAQLSQANNSLLFSQVTARCFKNLLARGRVRALHEHGPNIAGIVDTAIDLAAAESQELNAFGHPLPLVHPEAGSGQLDLKYLGQAVL